jgi:hypothetical protein
LTRIWIVRIAAEGKVNNTESPVTVNVGRILRRHDGIRSGKSENPLQYAGIEVTLEKVDLTD